MSRGPQRVRREVERSDAASSTPDCIESGRLGQRKTCEKSPFSRNFRVYRLSPLVRNGPDPGLYGRIECCKVVHTDQVPRHVPRLQVYFLLHGNACHHVHVARPRPRLKPRRRPWRSQAPRRLPLSHVSNASRSARTPSTNAAAGRTDTRWKTGWPPSAK